MNKDIELDHSLGFKQAGLNSYLRRCYALLRFAKPTPIQYYSINTYLTRNMSIVAQSKSGTGKTLSYVSIILTHIIHSQPLTSFCNYLIVVPTRELALQVYQNFKEIVGSFTHVRAEEEEGRVRQKLKQIRLLMSIGGIPFEDDRKKYLHQGGNIVVGTIGRVLEMVQKKLIQVNDLRMVVLDEGDKLFDSKNRKFADFLQQVLTLKTDGKFKVEFLLYSATLTKKLLQQITSKRQFVFIQTLVNSEGTLNVTVTEQVKDLSLGQAMGQQSDSLINLQNIKKYKWRGVQENCSFFNAKMMGLIKLLEQLSYLRCLVFVEKKTLLEQINQRLISAKLDALLIHGSLSQSSRIKLMNQINQSKIILASDLLARGIDIQLDLVILYDAKNNDTFWHRIGRTGRYNKMGVAISLDDIEGWQPYDRLKVQENLNEIQVTFNKGKQWYGKYMTQIGSWNQTTVQKQMQQAQQYRYFDQQKFESKKKRKQQTDEPLSVKNQNQIVKIDGCLQDLRKISNQAQLNAFIQMFLKCSKCQAFIQSVEEMTGYYFKIKKIVQ